MADGTRSLTWDAQGCLLSVSQTTPSASVTSLCDAAGRHVFRASTSGSTTRRALTVGALELRGAPENILVHRLPVGGTSVVEVVYKLTSSTRDSRSRIAFFDARGSEVATAPLSTTTANVAEAWDFDAWGKSTLLTSTAPRYGFVGFEPDVAFGTYAFGRRVYDPSLRRWLSPDPLAAVDPEAVTVPELDLWGYAGANPVKHVDRHGEAIETAFDVASIATDVAAISSWDANTSVLTKVVDVVGLVVDVGAAALPGIPGGAGIAIAALRAGDKAHDVANVADAASDAAKVAEKAAEAKKAEATAESMGSTRLKAKERRAVEKAKAKESKFGERDEPATEDYMKFKAKQVEKEKGKDARRKLHDAKGGRIDRTRKEIDDDIK